VVEILVRSEAMSSKPALIAYVIEKPEGKPDAKGYWREVGAVWPHGRGGGFDLVIHRQLSVTGRIVCVERREKPGQPGEADDTADNG
jgi:hypothetical protein